MQCDLVIFHLGHRCVEVIRNQACVLWLFCQIQYRTSMILKSLGFRITLVFLLRCYKKCRSGDLRRIISEAGFCVQGVLNVEQCHKSIKTVYKRHFCTVWILTSLRYIDVGSTLEQEACSEGISAVLKFHTYTGEPKCYDHLLHMMLLFCVPSRQVWPGGA